MPFVTGNLLTQQETSNIEKFQNHVLCIFCADNPSCFSTLIALEWQRGGNCYSFDPYPNHTYQTLGHTTMEVLVWSPLSASATV